MGLDGVELIMAVEEEFRIAIPDSEAEQCVTVEKLLDVVLPKLRQSNTDPCRSQHGFYIIRKILMDELALKRTQIKLNTKLDDLIERSQRPEIWRKLMDAAPCPNASLFRPAWLSHLVFWIIPVLVCVVIVLGGWLSVGLTITVGIGIAIIGALVTAPFKLEYPSNASEIKDIVWIVAPLDSRIWTKDEVFLKIREITAVQFGVEESEVTLETDYVKDLGC